jgi:hypothetical protein
MLKLFIFILISFFQQTPVTLTGIEYIKGTDSLKVSVRLNHELFLRDYQQTIFDDLDMEVLRNFNPFPADLANNYINSKINIYANNKLIVGKLLKMENSDMDIRFSLLYRVDKRLKSITVVNSILTGLYSDVVNLTIVRSRNFESERKFTQDHNEETFIIK